MAGTPPPQAGHCRPRLWNSGAKATKPCNLDSATAAKFEEIRRLAPHHPAGDLYLATILWLGHLNKTRRLQSGLYGSGQGFYADVDKAKEGSEGDAVDADVDRAFREKMAQAKTKALALVARNKNDADALYFLGLLRRDGGLLTSVARKFFSAMRNGRGAWTLTKKS